MASNGNSLRAGALIIGTAVVALGIVVVISGPERFAAKQDYVAKFKLDQNLQGLRPGDEVRLGGVRIGSVKDIVIDDAAESPEISVMMSLPKKYTFYDGATVSVEGLIGSASLNIDSIGDSKTKLTPDGHFKGSPGLFAKMNAAVVEASKEIPKVDAAIEQFRLLASDARTKNLADFTRTADTATQLLEDIRSKLGPMVVKYNAVADEAKVTAKNFGDFVGPSTGPANQDFRQTLANMRESTGKLPELAKKIDRAIDSVNERLDALKGTSEDLRAALTNTRDVTAEVKAILLDNRARIDRIVSSVEATTNNAKAFTAEVLHRPSRLIWRDDEKTQGNLNVYFTAREFSEGAAELNDAAASLRDAVKDPRLTTEQLKERIELLNASFDHFSEIQEKLYKSIKP